MVGQVSGELTVLKVTSDTMTVCHCAWCEREVKVKKEQIENKTMTRCGVCKGNQLI